MKYQIKPFVSVSSFVLNENRDTVIGNVKIPIKKTFEEIHGDNHYLIDVYDGVLAYYNNKRLFYVMFAPLPSIDLIFNDLNLFTLPCKYLYNLLKRYDKNIFIEDYVGFGSTKLGMDIYAPNFTEYENCKSEAISIAIKGYFDAIYNGSILNIDSLQNHF